MAYSKNTLKRKSLHAIEEYNLVFIDEIHAYLPCSKRCFYDHDLHNLPDIKEALEANRIELKRTLRKKWYASKNAAVQIALYKLIGTEEETARISAISQKTELTGKQGGPVEITTRVIEPDLSDLTTEELITLKIIQNKLQPGDVEEGQTSPID